MLRRLSGNTRKILSKDAESFIPMVIQKFCSILSSRSDVHRNGWWTTGIKRPRGMLPRRCRSGVPMQTVKSRGPANVCLLNTLKLTALHSSDSSAPRCCLGNKCRVPSTRTPKCQSQALPSGNNTSGRTKTLLQSSNKCLRSCQNISRPAKHCCRRTRWQCHARINIARNRHAS